MKARTTERGGGHYSYGPAHLNGLTGQLVKDGEAWHLPRKTSNYRGYILEAYGGTISSQISYVSMTVIPNQQNPVRSYMILLVPRFHMITQWLVYYKRLANVYLGKQYGGLHRNFTCTLQKAKLCYSAL